MRPVNEWPDQVKLVFASDKENLPASAFIMQAERKKTIVYWERCSNFNQLVDTIRYVHRVLSKTKPATKVVVGIQEKEKAKATIFKLLQHKTIDVEIKSLNAEK